jgi:replicative DNA helicase
MPPDRSAPDRLPPHNPDAERSVLGSILRDNRVIDEIHTDVGLRADQFYADAHQKIYEAILFLRESQPPARDGQSPIDLITLSEELRQRGQIEDVGGYGYLGELWDAAPTAANAVYYAKIVHDHSDVRNLIHAGTEILREAYDQAKPAKELLEDAERKIMEIAERGSAAQTFTLEQAVNDAYKLIDDRFNGEVDSSGTISTGYRDLDELTAGLHATQLVIIAARPSVGKTAFALNLLRNIVNTSGHPAFFVSLEQSGIELAERLLCCQAKVNSHSLRKGTLNADEMERLIEAGGMLRNAKMFIDDSPAQGMLRIAANARRLKRRENIKIVVIDYLQLIEPDNRRDPRQEQVAQISRRLKFLAKELKIPVVALAQVNRSSEDRQDHRPRLSDLRESGSIEQDADTVMLLHRPDRYEPGQRERIIEVIVGKSRNGPTGEVTLTYLSEYMRFDDHEQGTPFDR